MAMFGAYFPEFDFDRSGDHDASEEDAINKALGVKSPFLSAPKRREDEHRKGEAPQDASATTQTAGLPV